MECFFAWIFPKRQCGMFGRLSGSLRSIGDSVPGWQRREAWVVRESGGVKMYIKHHEPESRLRRSAVMLSLIGAILFPLAGYIDWGKPVGDQGTRGMLQVSEIPSPEVWGSATAACSVSKDGGGCPTASSRTSPAKSDLSRLP